MVPYTDLEEKTVQNTINYANGTKRYIVPFSSTEQFLGGTLAEWRCFETVLRSGNRLSTQQTTCHLSTEHLDWWLFGRHSA
jgi:hypothetical protein